MSKEPQEPKTPDESIPQDPGVPGPATKNEGDWPPESGAQTSSARRGFARDAKEREETTVSEASGQRTPRHRVDDERETER